MKKYLKLTPREAIEHFIHHNDTFIPETTDEVRQKLQYLNKQQSSLSVTITLPTQRIAPNMKYETLNLKNLILKAEETLQKMVDKRKVIPFIENLKEAQEFVIQSHNWNSMVIYANEHFSSVIKLPIHLNEEVAIGQNFDIRPLIQTEQQNQYYYILTISKQKIRLIEVLSNKLTFELENDDFPFINTHFYTTDPEKLKQDVFMDNLTKEFFNAADKRFRNYRLVNPFPIVLMGNTKSVSHYEEVMDDKRMVISRIDGNYDNTPRHEIIKTAEPAIEQFRENVQNAYKAEIDTALSQNLLATDIDEIFSLATEGNAATLLIGTNYKLKGVIGNDNHITIDSSTDNSAVITNDLTNELIKKVYRQNGKVVFLNDDLLKRYNGLVLIKRFK